MRNYKAIAQHSTAHSLWRKFPPELQRTRPKPSKFSRESQDFINNWPCSDAKPQLYKNCYSVRTSAILFRNQRIM